MIVDSFLSYLFLYPPASTLLFISATVFIRTAAYSYFFHPYADIPGPFWAKVSRLWLARQVVRGDIDKTQRALHQNYGPIVRVAPNELSISDPTALKVIYAVNSGFSKTDFYLPFAAHLSQNEDFFTQQDEKHHAPRCRVVNNLYSLSSILESEQYIDTYTVTFMSRLDEFDSSCRPWTWDYGFRCMPLMSSFGFMENRHDYGRYIESLDALLPAVAVACVLPSYVRPLQVLGHLFPPLHRALKCYDNIVRAAKQAVRDRQAQVEKNAERSDLLDKLFNVAATEDDFSLADVTTKAWVSLFAGSNTTAIAMRSILYNIIKNPEVNKKVTAEIDDAASKSRLSTPVKYPEAIRLPYFVACCREGFRVHPSVGMSMPRHVPPSGATIAGRYFKGGSRVGMSANVLHFDKDIFGEDADSYNPD
ncbi:hypothetical protein NCS56_01518600 [Fusarium sp. Ph1]|nr:hypothetical protein NCS56_01518600 [Fusarium sp. Ph1]